MGRSQIHGSLEHKLMKVSHSDLQLIMSSSNTLDSKGKMIKKKKIKSLVEIQSKLDTLDEVLMIPNWDINNLNLD